MSFKERIPYFFVAVIILILSCYIISDKISFEGDELGTLDIEKIHKPIPYHNIISSLINFLEPINKDDIFFLRLSSLLFTLITVFLWYLFYIRTKIESITFLIFIVTSSFILDQSIFFRYYSYYFFSSSLTFFFLKYFVKKLSINYKLFFCFIGLVFSPFIFHILNGIQFGIYFIYIFLFEKIINIRIRLLIISILLILILIFILNPVIIWSFFNWINILEELHIDTKFQNIYGFNKTVFIKPFYAIYQMIFGFDLAPTYSIFILISTFVMFSFLIYLLYKIYILNKKSFIDYLVIGIIPFLIIYLFFQVISFPGFTQLESKHGILLYPIIISMILESYKYFSKKIFIFSFSGIIIFQIIGQYHNYNTDNTNWDFISEKINNISNNSENINILMDGRSKQPFLFYNQNIISQDKIFYTWESMDSLEDIINNDKELILLLNDYKSYTQLSLRQNWNAGTSSANRVKKLDDILQKLNYNYIITDSYVKYPTFLYLLKRKLDQNNNYSTFGVWEHHLKDLELPIYSERKILSSVIIKPLDSLEVNFSNNIVLNYENCFDNITTDEKIGFYRLNNKTYDLVSGRNIWNIFSDFNTNSNIDKNIFYHWYHKPLVSGSVNYEGSYFGNKASIYLIKIDEKSFQENILIKNTSKYCYIRIWI